MDDFLKQTMSTPANEENTGLRTSTKQQCPADIIGVVCSYLDARHLLCVSCVNRSWCHIAAFYFRPEAKSYFRNDFVHEPTELALPSHIVAMSVSADCSHLFVCARSSDESEEVLLYVHHLPSGQRYFESLPRAFAIPTSTVAFEGPHFLTTSGGSTNGGLTVFDCERGYELCLPDGAQHFCASSSGRYVGCLVDDAFYVVRFSSSDRQAAVDAAEKRWAEDVLSRNNRMALRTQRARVAELGEGGDPRGDALSAPSVAKCYHLKIAEGVPAAHSSDAAANELVQPPCTSTSRLCKNVVMCIPNASATFDSLSDFFVMRDTLIVSHKSQRIASLKAYFISQAPSSASEELHQREVNFLFSSMKCTPLVVEGSASTPSHMGSVGGCVYLLDAASGTLYTWYPHSCVARAVAIPALFCPETRRFPTACEFLRVAVPGEVLCFTTWRTSAASYVEHDIHFVSLDGSLHRSLPMKGKSVVALCSRDSSVITSLWTASSGPAHPLLEATEYGIGAITRFGVGSCVVSAVEQERSAKNRRLMWLTWVCGVVMGVSLLTTVCSLVYNGWWLHMQFLFAPV